MLGQNRIKRITDQVLARSTADQTEVAIQARDSALTRFANSTIHQNVAETNAEVRIRAVLGKRVGVATTSSLADEALAHTLDRALAIARLQPENPDFQSLPGPQPIPAVSAFRDRTAASTPEQRARGVGAICLMSRAAGMVASGALTTTALELAVANSLGTFAYFPATRSDINAVVMGESGSGYAEAVALDVGDLDPEAIGREAVQKCLRSQNPRPCEPGQYTVILEPYAVHDFLEMMTYTGFGATALQEGRSFMSGRLGQQIVDARVSIWDDGQDPRGVPIPFDLEGVPRQRVDLIQAGVARGVVYDSYRAAREGRASTGHALPALNNNYGPLPLNLFFGQGHDTLEEMIRSTERGLYVTRFHYTRPVEPARVVITGMTRDGTFLIEKGEIAHPVKNLRFTQSYLEALNNLEQIGGNPRLLLGLMGNAAYHVPALKLGQFTFTGATEF